MYTELLAAPDPDDAATRFFAEARNRVRRHG
jgi:hypothetical protein